MSVDDPGGGADRREEKNERQGRDRGIKRASRLAERTTDVFTGEAGSPRRRKGKTTVGGAFNIRNMLRLVVGRPCDIHHEYAD